MVRSQKFYSASSSAIANRVSFDAAQNFIMNSSLIPEADRSIALDAQCLKRKLNVTIVMRYFVLVDA